MIAIVGSAHPNRVKELGLIANHLAADASRDLGRALARKRCHIVVYDSAPGFLETDVVSGYCEIAEVERDSIQVRYSKDQNQPNFAEYAKRKELFSFRTDPSAEWEPAFYNSLSEVDGIILLGGGSSTLIAGLVALSHRKAIVACASFGGAAKKVWATLSPTPRLHQQDIFLMMQPWQPDLADKLVDTILAQIERGEQEKKERERQVETRIEAARLEERAHLADANARRRKLNAHAIVGAIMTIAALGMWIVSWSIGLKMGVQLTLLIGAAVLAGAAGGSIRAIGAAMQGKSIETDPLVLSALAGFVAGGISGALFTIAPLMGTDGKTALTAARIQGLVPFVMCVGFIAGLTFDLVFTRLREANVLRRDALNTLGSGSQSQ